MDQNVQFQPTDIIAVRLQAQQWNVVMSALAEIPWRMSAPIIEAIRGQSFAGAFNPGPDPDGDPDPDPEPAPLSPVDAGPVATPEPAPQAKHSKKRDPVTVR